VQRGLNFSLISTSLHDSGAGWSSILTPDLAFRFNRYFSVDFSTPAFASITTSLNTGTKANPIYTTESKHFVLGDSTFAGHFDLHGSNASYSLTSALGLPTGNNTYGLTANQLTYTVNNHVDTSIGFFSPDLEVGITDSSVLVQRRLRHGRAFNTTGTLAHFQAGGSIDLPRHASFEADAYEELPLGNQKIYGKAPGKNTPTGRRARGNTSVPVSPGAAEDNGVSVSLDAPVNAHIVLSGIYGHSIRQQDDTVGVSLTYLLRARPGSE
jgi:hypothetical protein